MIYYEKKIVILNLINSENEDKKKEDFKMAKPIDILLQLDSGNWCFPYINS